MAPPGTTDGVQIADTAPGGDRFAEWCAVWAHAELHDRPAEPARAALEHEALARELLAPGSARSGAHRALLDDDGRVVGALRLICPERDNTSLAVVDLAVLPDARRRGHGTALLAEAHRLATAAGRTRLLSEVDEPLGGSAGRGFAEAHGWTCDLVETRRDLLLPLDEERVAAVEADARARSAGYALVTWRDRTPEELVESRALLERRMSTDAPTGDLPVEEEDWDAARVRAYEALHLARGRTVLSAGAVHDGALVAFTDLHVPTGDPRRAHQGGTLVLREHRGHRLGALVKAATLRRLASEHPGVQRICTYNAEDNVPMVAVNAALGYVPTGALCTWSWRA